MIPQQNEDRKDILCYTRLPQEDIVYASKLAYSMHLAYKTERGQYQALNHNSGVLFAKATENEDGTLRAKSLKQPYLFYLADGNFGVLAVRTEADGEADDQSKGKVLLFSSADLLQYSEIGLLELKADTHVSDVYCTYDPQRSGYLIRWIDGQGQGYENFTADIMSLTNVSEPVEAEPFTLEAVQADIEGIQPRNVISVSAGIARRLFCKLTVPENIAVVVPDRVNAASVEDVKAVGQRPFTVMVRRLPKEFIGTRMPSTGTRPEPTASPGKSIRIIFHSRLHLTVRTLALHGGRENIISLRLMMRIRNIRCI